MFDKRKDGNQEGPKAHFDAGLNDLSANTQARQTQASGRAAVIGPRIKINGDVSGEENLVIEGRVEGSVHLKEYRVDVGPSGIVKANIDAKVVKIDGTVQGDVVASEMATISRTGNVRGNITAPRMTLEDGAKFKGSIDMDPGDAAKGDASKKDSKVEPKADRNPAQEAKSTSNGAAPVPDKGKGEQGLPLKS
ncbi:MAG: polymer-forming cytoskeletal protein [Xanthomonadales bacterium]|jgi:cytoskeletal protein CcmA (bactofilin family)|nr:polymer-forming cytoskeletal protein [Xanthomonadales bacterium]